MEKLSVVVITLNEEKNLGRCLDSVAWADEIIVVDSGSTDRTEEIAREYGAQFYVQEWLGYGGQKNKAISLSSFKWCLSIDADEEVGSVLKDSIKATLKEPKASCYKVKRSSYFLGKKMRYGGWGRNTAVRLFNKEIHIMSEALVHEAIEVDKSKVALLTGYLIHYTQDSIEISLKKMNEYSSLGAEMLAADAKKNGFWKAYFRGKFTFFRNYILFFGFLDGKRGFILAQIMASGAYFKYLKRAFDVKS